MENALYLILGTLISCWIAKYAHFKELRLRAYEALIEATIGDAAQRFSSDSRFIINAFFPVQIAFFAAGHDRAGNRVRDMAERLTRDFEELQMQPILGSSLQLVLHPSFEMKVAAFMKESDLPDRIDALPFDWDAILNPF